MSLNYIIYSSSPAPAVGKELCAIYNHVQLHCLHHLSSSLALIMRFSVTQSMLYTKNLKEKYFSIALLIREQVKIMTILSQFLYILFRIICNKRRYYVYKKY